MIIVNDSTSISFFSETGTVLVDGDVTVPNVDVILLEDCDSLCNDDHLE